MKKNDKVIKRLQHKATDKKVATANAVIKNII